MYSYPSANKHRTPQPQACSVLGLANWLLEEKFSNVKLLDPAQSQSFVTQWVEENIGDGCEGRSSREVWEGHGSLLMGPEVSQVKARNQGEVTQTPGEDCRIRKHVCKEAMMSEGSTQELNSLRKHRIWARCLENTPGRFSLRHGGQACCKNRCRYCYLFLLLTFAQDLWAGHVLRLGLSFSGSVISESHQSRFSTEWS